MNANNTSLLFSFGIVADVQYGDKPSGGLEGRVQNYREAPGKLALAIKDWISKKDAISFVLTLGDVIEGIKGEVEQSLIDLEVVAKILDELAAQTQVHHVVGNHCLRASREALLGRLKIPSNYYSVPIHEADGGGDKWKLVVLDTTEMSLYSRYSEDSVQMTETRAFVEAHPEEEFPCMKIWNGGITTQQKQWLIDQLASSNETGESVIIACHHPVGKGSASELHMAWNAPEIESILCEAPCVKVVLTGHYHPGGYAMIQGKHFVTLEGLLEAPSNSNAFGYVHVFKDRIEIQGEGELSSRVLQMYKGT
ncbi:hypothetical protein BSKO_02986 [Bryopsis sp. KO-2023]|nr:hypothetical protein BSKO_02986 [Bryopsis sp. KO-2023]